MPTTSRRSESRGPTGRVMPMGSRRRPVWWLLGLLAAVAPAALAAAPASTAQPAAGPNGVERCVAAFGEGVTPGGGPVTCRVSYRLTEEERGNLVRLTGGALLDAACDLDLDLGRELVVAALLGPEALEVPPQDGTCRFETAATAAPLDVAFLVAPTVWFEGGRATRATPNVHGIRGLPPFLSDILAQAINRDPEIEAVMVAEVNAFLDGVTR